MRGLKTLIFPVLCIVAQFQARGAEYTSPQGFSLEYPDSWKVASKELLKAAEHEAQPLLEKVGAVDFDQVAVIVLSPTIDKFVENVNVVVASGAPPVDEQAKREYVQGLTEQYSGMGLRPSNVKSELIEVGDRRAISVRLDAVFPGQDEPIRQWQVLVPAGRRLYVVTCSALASDFAQYEPVFSKIVHSLRSKGGLAEFWHNLPTILRYAIIGGLIGGVIGPLVLLAKKLAQR